MARSTLGANKSDLNGYLLHMRRAVSYTSKQTTGLIMRTTPNGAEKRKPTTRSRPQSKRPEILAYLTIDAAYLAAHPFTP